MTATDWNPLHGTDWDPLLRQEFTKEYWICLQKCIEQERSCYNVYPPRDEVFAALRLTRCSDTKVVIVGQDRITAPATQAHGLAFSVVMLRRPESVRSGGRGVLGGQARPQSEWPR